MAAAIEVAFDGRMPKPSLESWGRFELNTVVDQYIEMLFEVSAVRSGEERVLSPLPD